MCGWLKRGPTGLIGTNLADAEETVDTLVATRDQLPGIISATGGGAAALQHLLEQRGVRCVGWRGWERLDAEEMKRGAVLGKVRDKVADLEEMLALAAEK